MKKLLLLHLLLGIVSGAFAQHAPSNFAGVPTNSTIQHLASMGFSCVASVKRVTVSAEEVICIDQSYRGTFHGVPLARRGVLFINGAITSIRVTSPSFSDPSQVFNSMMAGLRANHQLTVEPRILVGAVNRDKSFWRVGVQHTLVVGPAIPDGQGGYFIAASMILPAGH